MHRKKTIECTRTLILGLNNSCNVASLYVYCDFILYFQSHERLSHCVLLVFKSNIFLARVIEKFEFNVLQKKHLVSLALICWIELEVYPVDRTIELFIKGLEVSNPHIKDYMMWLTLV